MNKKAVSKKAASKKAAPKKAASKKTASKKAASKKTAPKKTAPKKTASKKTASKKTAPKKAASKKAAPKKAASKKASAGKAPNKKAPNKKAPAQTIPTKRTARRDGTLHLLDVPFEDRKLAAWGGARFDPGLRRWVYTGYTLPDRLAPYAPRRHSWEAWRQHELNGTTVDNTPGAGVVLREHQQAAVGAIARARAAGRGGFLLADDVGLGKTYATVAGINEIGSDLRVLVLCPLSVCAHWARSIDDMGTGGNEWCVINYDRAKQLLEMPESASTAKRTRTRNKRHAAQGRSIVDWDVVVLDEAHKLKNPTSQRSAAVRQLVRGHGDSAFVVYLSATAGQNPLELAYLAPLLGEVSGQRVGRLEEFETWVRGQGFSVRRGSFGQWSWERNDADLQRMHELLFNPAGHDSVRHALRRRPQDLVGWPEITRVLWPEDLDAAQMRAYLEAYEELRERLALDRGAKKGGGEDNPLVAALRFRQKASLLRVPQTVRFAGELLEDGYQVAISCQFLDTAALIAEGLGTERVAVISGELDAAQREAQRIGFQQGGKPACVFTVCEGISLHAGEEAVGGTDTDRVLLLHDLRWSALEVAQIEGRCHRDGRRAVAYYLYGTDTAEEKVAEAVLGRLTDMATMLGDETTGLDALLAAVR